MSENRFELTKKYAEEHELLKCNYVLTVRYDKEKGYTSQSFAISEDQIKKLVSDAKKLFPKYKTPDIEHLEKMQNTQETKEHNDNLTELLQDYYLRGLNDGLYLKSDINESVNEL